jgi:type IV pilus assembly protein PilX
VIEVDDMKTHGEIQAQDGAALVIGLILLVVITVLAISGMNTATTELAIARNDQNHENAFQAAETGLEQALAETGFDTSGPTTVTTAINDHDSVTTQIRFAGSTIVPDKAFSLGTGSGIAAYHFVATASSASRRTPGSASDRDAEATHTQAFYIVGPQAPAL